MSTKDLGIMGETMASEFLQKKGYQILQRNFRSKFGEIDLICLDQEVLVFVEVKTRWSDQFGLPEEAITPWQIRRIIKTGQYYKMLHPKLPESLRIDAVAIDLYSSGEVKDIKLYQNISQ